MTTHRKKMQLNLEPTCDTAVVIGFTNAWAAPAAVVLQAFQDQHPGQAYDSVLMVQGLDAEDRDRLNRIRPSQFIDYQPAIAGTERFKRVSTMAFSRYECWAMLEHYQRVLWIDADTLPVGEVLSCFDQCSNSGIGLIEHTGTPIRVSFMQDVPDYDMQRTCFNSGFIALNRNVGDYHAQRDWLYDATAKWADHVSSDQAVINMLFQAYDLPVTKLPGKYNCSPDQPVDDVRVLHPWGNHKFWDGLSHSLWDDYHQRWCAMGGTPAPEPKRIHTPPPSVLRRGLAKMRRMMTAPLKQEAA